MVKRFAEFALFQQFWPSSQSSGRFLTSEPALSKQEYDFDLPSKIPRMGDRVLECSDSLAFCRHSQFPGQTSFTFEEVEGAWLREPE
ncbi:hypothetical protein A6X21_17215 [Planctopirus hydrillae]|uniref:Uncharacterized protein n=1 Tax=Planctopirus hydrillae TaxID=1841610 RepID=A0A1C3EQK7_9PLAN|nr:hypothetical protein A6X21_17215 [Planctopirus hydrillae]